MLILLGFVFDIWVLEDGVLVLEGFIAFQRGSGVHADGHVELEDREHCYGEPKWECDGIVLIWKVVNAKVVENPVGHESPDQVQDEDECR